MKPNIGDVVYCIYDGSLAKDKVGYIGKDSFILDEISPSVKLEACCFFYDEYNINWFSTFKEAKTALLSKYKNAKLKKITDDYWEVK